MNTTQTGIAWGSAAHFDRELADLGEWVCEVCQSAYGHKARKRTWLLYVGDAPPDSVSTAQTPGTHQVGWFDRNKPSLGKKEASRTPVEFAEYLVRLAGSAGRSACVAC